MTAEEMDTTATVTVQLPELFKSFLAAEPRVHPSYEKVRKESEDAIISFCNHDQRVTTIVRKGDFSRFVAIAAPDADESRLRTYCDWCNWVFPYDDLFDNGQLRMDAAAAQAKMQALFASMDSTSPTVATEQCKLIQFHTAVWSRIRSSASIGVQRRFRKTMRQFCDAVLHQVFNLAADDMPTVEQMLTTRRQSVGVAPLLPLYEYANDLDLPDDFFDHAALQELEDLGMDCALLQNDILSYVKEEAEGVPHNVVAICRIRGMAAQQAFDHVGSMLDERLDRIQSCIERIPDYEDERLAFAAKSYIQGVRNTVAANLYWSFESKRYFGEDAELIRHLGTVEVLRDPPFMSRRM